MNQTIDNIITHFGRANWFVEKANQNYWIVRPKGLYNYKTYLLTYNPFNDKYTLVKFPTPNDPHYNCAVKILEAALGESNRSSRSTSDCSHLRCRNLSIIKVPSMFPIKISATKWINLAQAREITLKENGDLLVIWDSCECSIFKEGEEADNVLTAINEAYETALNRLSGITA